MLLVKKAINVGLFLGAFAYIAVAHQVAAITLATPISATDPLIAATVNTVVGSSDVGLMRNNVRQTTMGIQSKIDTSQAAVDAFEQLPMQQIVMPMMQQAIMIPIMESLSDVTNTDGLVYVFAPDQFPVAP